MPTLLKVTLSVMCHLISLLIILCRAIFLTMAITPSERWIIGLTGGFIGGGAGAVTASFSAAMIAPESFNVHAGLMHLLALIGSTFLINGLLGAALYLKDHPVPLWDASQPDRRNGHADGNANGGMTNGHADAIAAGGGK